MIPLVNDLTARLNALEKDLINVFTHINRIKKSNSVSRTQIRWLQRASLHFSRDSHKVTENLDELKEYGLPMKFQNELMQHKKNIEIEWAYIIRHVSLYGNSSLDKQISNESTNISKIKEELESFERWLKSSIAVVENLKKFVIKIKELSAA